MFKHILVTTDGSSLSALAFPVAADLARTYGSALTLLYVVPPPPLLPGLGDRLAAPFVYREPRPEVQAEAEHLLSQAAAQLGVPGALLVQRASEGQPVAPLIAEEVQSCGADLVVMGTLGRSGLAHLLLGSVAEQVVQAVSVPVLLVRAPLATRSLGADQPGLSAELTSAELTSAELKAEAAR